MNRNKLNHILGITRQSGNATWIIESLKHNPKCIVVCANQNSAHILKGMYLSENGTADKNDTYPLFLSGVSSEHKFRGRRVPVIFDNSALFDEAEYISMYGAFAAIENIWHHTQNRLQVYKFKPVKTWWRFESLFKNRIAKIVHREIKDVSSRIKLSELRNELENQKRNEKI